MQLPYEELQVITSVSLVDATVDEGVAALRCRKGADLVQVVGYYGFSCGRG